MISVRLATPADVPAIHKLVESAYRGDSARAGWTHEADLLDGQRTDREALTAIIADPDQRLLLAVDDDGGVAGCVVIAMAAGDRAYLGMLSVDPVRQAGGLGRRLMAEAEAAAIAHFGARTMEMTVIRQRHELIAYYERRGYARTGEERPFPMDDARFGLPRMRDLAFVVLAKPLTAADGVG